NLSMNGGTSGTITLTTGVWTVSGSWDSTGLGSILNSDTSTVTFTGTSQTIGLASGQMFYNLTIGGTVSTTSAVTAAGALTVNNGAVLTKTGQNLAFNALTEIGTGSIVDGTVIVVGFSVTNTDATNLTTISVFTNPTADTQYTWTDFSSVGTSTITFTIGGNTVGNRFNVTKDGALFTNGIVDGSVKSSSPCSLPTPWSTSPSPLPAARATDTGSAAQATGRRRRTGLPRPAE